MFLRRKNAVLLVTHSERAVHVTIRCQRTAVKTVVHVQQGPTASVKAAAPIVVCRMDPNAIIRLWLPAAQVD